MKRVTILIAGIILLSSLASAEIIINEQPEGRYNLGDTISVPVTIKTLTEISGTFEMYLLCNGHELNFYKNGVGLSVGEEQEMDPSLVLTREIIGQIQGDCVIKSILGEEYVLSNEFQISSIINLQITNEENEFKPGEAIIIRGEATKANGEVDGFIEFTIATDNSTETITHLETISNGFFLANISISEKMKAGSHAISINAYEKDLLGEISNQGSLIHNIVVQQIPTNLEILFENSSEIEPGTNALIKVILHDQTGEKINTLSIVTIKNKKNKIMEQTEVLFDEFLEFPITYNQAPEEFKVIAVSNKLTAESSFQITEKKEVKVEIINKTLILTNMGNVPYSDNVLIKIGEEALNVNTSLEVDEEQRYVLSAPDGEYQIEVMNLKESVMLTGKSIDVKRASTGVMSLVRYPFVWVFMIFIMGFVAFTIFKKGYKRSFIGRIRLKKKKGEIKEIPLRKNSLINTRNKAELSLAIKGDKQNISLMCLKIKNLKEIESKKGNAKETIQKIVELAEENKAHTYENQESIFFLLAPSKTKTFKNEKIALEVSQQIKEALDHHNKLFSQKIDFGISLNYGTIVSKQEPGTLKFMSMGQLITTAKKIASLAHNDLLLGEKINERVTTEVKTEKQIKNKMEVFTIKEIKHKKENEKFIKQFLNRIEKK